MIDEIEVSDLALIKDATIAPSSKMTVITGETGAGKTALLAACRLLMGERADRDMVRTGSSEARVFGRFFVNCCAEESAEDYFRKTEETSEGCKKGLPEVCAGKSAVKSDKDTAEVVVERSVSDDGRSRVRIDGHMASVTELSELIGPSISLCSQHDQIMLVKPSMHRIFLDRWAKICESKEFIAYTEAFVHEKECREKLEQLRVDIGASDAKLEEARFTLKQIDAVGPSAEDYNELISTLNKSENVELLARTTSESHAALAADEGVLDQLNAAIALLEDGARVDGELGEYAATLRDALYSIEDVAREVGRYEHAFDFDAASIELMQQRVSAYQSLMRAYGPTLDDVLAASAAARATVEALGNSDQALAQAEDALAKAESALSACASKLHDARAAAAPNFARDINAQLAHLAMGTSELSCEVGLLDRQDWTATGPDDIRFMFSPAKATRPRPLSKIASGGELGRVMLALHVVMGDKDDVDTLVFDEIDAGVGGSVAQDLGEMMSRLALTHQVLVVTHSASIAAYADKHYVASKLDSKKGTETQISEVKDDARVSEIARMLSGEPTEASLIHARELLDSASK